MKKLFTLSTLYFLLCTITASAAVSITKSGGWYESAYVEWTKQEGYSYNVYVSPTAADTWTQLDYQLVREYPAFGRADALGLSAGSYKLKVVPVKDEVEITAEAAETGSLTVVNHDRGGFAHFKSANASFNPANGVGAYTNNGTLKSGAKVLYVTADNAANITTDVVTDSKGKKTTGVGLQDIITLYQKGQDTTPICFRIIGTVKKENLDRIDSSAEGLQIKGRNANSELNITIEGVGFDATIHGFGILIRNACSVELRNFASMWCMDDGISLDTDNSNIWVHNLDMFYGKPGSAADQKKGDGTIDVKSDSKYVTISYNHLWDSGKSSLCGMTSESGPNWITYHHNWFDHSDSRHPRIRTMSVHIYNNYFDGNSKYGVGAAQSSNAFVENNYFRNCKYPMLISRQGSDVNNGEGSSDQTKGTFSGEDGGVIKAFGNFMTGEKRFQPWTASGVNNTHFDAYVAADRNETVPSTVAALQGGRTYDNFDTNPELIYSGYQCDAAADVPVVVTGDLGAGRCNHGDFSWTFPASEDNNDAVISALSTAIQNYTTTLVGFFGKAVNPGGDTPGGGDTPDTPGGGDLEGDVIYKYIIDQTIPAAVIDGTTQNYSEKIATQGGYIVIGNVSKVEQSTISSSGFAMKLDGDAKEGNTKYAKVFLNTPLKISDKITLICYATSTPSSDYGLSLYDESQTTKYATVYSTKKNTEETFTISVPDNMVGLSTFCICRNSGKSTYLVSVAVTGETPTAIATFQKGRADAKFYDLAGRPVTKAAKGHIYISQGKKAMVK